MRSFSAHNDYKGVWVAAERRWWHMTTESVLTHSEKHDWAGTHKTREDVQKMHSVTSLDKAAHHRSTRMYREKPERQKYTAWFVQNKISFMHKIFLDLLSKRTKWGVVWQQMTCIWVEYAGMILYNFMQRWGTWEETIISKWLSALRGMTCPGRISL